MEDILTLQEFLKQFPWTEEELASGDVAERLWHYDLKVTDDQIWPLIVNSNLLNKETGSKPITYKEKGNLLYGTTGKDANREEWIEYPWEWVYCQWGKRVRKYTLSLITYNRVIYLIQKKEKGIRLYIYIGSTIKNPANLKTVNQFLDVLEPKYKKCIEKFEHDVLEGESITIKQLSQQSTKDLEKLLIPYKNSGLDAKLAAKLLTYILTAEDDQLGRIRLVPLARAWNVDLYHLLSLCLHACKFGHLQLSWDTICPHCRGVRQENPYLSQIPLSGKCEICEIDYETSKDGAVEVVFHVHPSLREVRKIFYCAAEPHHKTHIKVQEHIKPGTSKHIEADLPSVDYRMRAIGSTSPPMKATFTASELANRQHWSIEVKNPGEKPLTFVFEDQKFDTGDFLKPKYLFNTREFRALFNDEQLPFDLNMDIGVQALVFADVVQSTRLYRDLGDAKSFNMIRGFMKEVFRIIEDNRGIVIKTMGDGAMFAFNQPLDALEASLAMQRLSEESKGLRLRVALNYGECIAVNFDYKIDYFGHTVNIASKLLAGSDPSDLVIAKRCLDMDEVKAYLKENGIVFEECEVSVQSLEASIPALRIHAHSNAKLKEASTS